jgi:hypothetical protein
MKRREFLQTGLGAGLLGVAGPAAPVLADPADGKRPASQAIPAVLSTYTAEDHRRRLKSIAFCEQRIRRCMRKHLITDYLPGQCVYNLGEYPCREPWNPDEWDEKELDALREQGIRLIQVHEEWNDSQRLFGQTKLTALNPAGFHRFVDMVHARGMKLIVYVSSGFFDRRDPDFRPEWARQQDLVEMYWHYARCSPASPGWRAYLLPRLMRILDDYGVDGFYNDLGYVPLASNPRPPAKDEILAFEERPDHEGALGDLLALIYAEVKRRAGIVKVHHSGNSCPHTEVKVYDYLWVGEGITQADSFREAVKNHAPYVVPCLDMSRARIDSEDDLYLSAIPYMQFPLLLAGRPFTGERATIPGIEYPPEEKCFWTRHNRQIWKYYRSHPNGPFSYGWWDSVPGRPEARPAHARWLGRYLPLVEEGTRAYLEIADSDLFIDPLPAGVVASAFANRELNIVLANCNRRAVECVTREAYVDVTNASAPAQKTSRLAGRSMVILRRPPVS